MTWCHALQDATGSRAASGASRAIVSKNQPSKNQPPDGKTKTSRTRTPRQAQAGAGKKGKDTSAGKKGKTMGAGKKGKKTDASKKELLLALKGKDTSKPTRRTGKWYSAL